MSTTRLQLRNTAYDLLRESQSGTSAYPSTLMNSLIDAALFRICAGTIINTINGQTINKGRLPFLEKRAFFSTIPVISTTSDIPTTAATTIDVTDTTSFPNAGSIWINWDTIAYTGKTATSFTGVTGIDYTHKEWSQVYILNTLPANYMNMIEVSLNNSYAVPFKDSAQMYRDRIGAAKGWNEADYPVQGTNALMFNSFFYSIWEGRYFFAPFNKVSLDNSYYTLHYEEWPAPLATDEAESPITIDQYSNIVSYIAVGEMLFNRWEGDYASVLLNYAYGQLQEMYSYYTNLSAETLTGQSVMAEKAYLNL